MKENIIHYAAFTGIIVLLFFFGPIPLAFKTNQTILFTFSFLSAMILISLYHFYWFKSKSKTMYLFKIGLMITAFMFASSVIANMTGLIMVFIIGKISGIITVSILMIIVAYKAYERLEQKNKLFDPAFKFVGDSEFFISAQLTNVNNLLTICRKKEHEGKCHISNKNEVKQRFIWINNRFAGALDTNGKIYIHKGWWAQVQKTKDKSNWMWFINGILNNTPMKTSFFNKLKDTQQLL
ncbi:MAG: hypothetical protein KAS30_03730 [Candidatus Diapherotrites archaeon]|nr:hypothetical protein [Candidatus Diapherotrites archaeon]